MSGGGGTGARPKLDIALNADIQHLPNKTAKRTSDVNVSVPIDPNKAFVIGIKVTKKQAARATVAITSPLGMAVAPENPPYPEEARLKTAFPPEAGYRWVAFTGTTPTPAAGGGGPAPSTALKTELTVDESEIDPNGFQIIPVVVHYGVDQPWKESHYIVGASVITGTAQIGFPFRGPRGVGQYAKTGKKPPRPKKKSKR